MNYRGIDKYLKEFNKNVKEETLFKFTEDLPEEMRGTTFVTKIRMEIENRKKEISGKLSEIPENEILNYFEKNSSEFPYLDERKIKSAIKD